MNADDYFIPYEKSISTLDDMRTRADQLMALASRTSLEFFWRGQSRADWEFIPLCIDNWQRGHSSVLRTLRSRRLWPTNAV
jgi:hypothetical protein